LTFDQVFNTKPPAGATKPKPGDMAPIACRGETILNHLVACKRVTVDVSQQAAMDKTSTLGKKADSARQELQGYPNPTPPTFVQAGKFSFRQHILL
jgi:hypothetical protein